MEIENIDSTVKLYVNGILYWEGTQEEYFANEQDLKEMCCDIYNEDYGYTPESDEVDVEWL